jgi:hypothetical protein
MDGANWSSEGTRQGPQEVKPYSTMTRSLLGTADRLAELHVSGR